MRRRVAGPGLVVLVTLTALGATPVADTWAAGPPPPNPSETTQPTQLETRLERCRLGLTEDRWREALAEARQLHAVAPTNPNVVAVLAESLFRAGLLVEAEQLLERQVQAGQPLAPRASVAQARLLAARGRRGAAALLMREAVASAADDPYVLYWAGDLEPDRDTAVSWLERYVALADAESDPDRLQAAKGAIRFYRELGDRRVWVPLTEPERIELPLRRIWDDTGRIEGFVVSVDLTAGRRKPVRLLLDTGSHGVLILDRVARKRGFTPLANTVQFGDGEQRSVAIKRGVLPEVRIGALHYRDALVKTTRQEIDPTGRFQGLIGLSVFGGYRLTLDLKRDRLVAQRSAEPLDGEPYWWISGQLLVTGQVRSKRVQGESSSATSATGLFVLDTGAGQSVIAQPLAEGAKPAGRSKLRGLSGVVPGAQWVQGLAVELQDLSSQGALVAMDFGLTSRLGGVEVGGLIGQDLLTGEVLHLDTRTQVFRVGASHSAPPAEAASKPSSSSRSRDSPSSAAR